ncbi:unnamed protein product [Urochloa decumbens]|uniref:Uncharacterized protein n=1 Tax=Urochloa decumbens TaxID=240449 RepID=A0ABC9E7A8_9POAL
MARAAIAFSGLCVGISAAVLLCSLSQSPPAAFDGAAQAAAAAAQLDPAAYGMLAATATFFTAINIIYVHLRTGGGGRRIPEVMFFILCASVGFLHLFCMQQPGPIQAPAVLHKVAAVQLLLPYAGAATFYLSLVLTYVHVRAAAAGGGAGDEMYPAAVEVLKTVTLAATLITGVLSSIAAAAALVFNTK